MTKTLADLASRMDKLAATLTLEGSRCAIEVAMTVTRDLAYKTPVDTSNALSNWQGSLNAPNLSEIDPHLPGVKGSTKIRSANATIDVMQDVLEDKKPGETIFIANAVPYIGRLNRGSSQQEPAGFVERAALLGRRQVKKFKLKLR